MGILTKLFGNAKPLYQIDRPEESKLFLQARDCMGRFIQSKMNEFGGFSGPDGFRWVRKELTSPSFDDMNFAYKNKVYSLLLELQDNGKNLLPEKRKKIFEEVCKKNNLIPCIFKLDAKTLKPIEGGWNMRELGTDKEIDPMKLSTDKKELMSAWELNNFAIFCVMKDLNKEGCKIMSFCDAPEIEPQIWFEDKDGKASWVVVRYCLYPQKPDEIKCMNAESIAAKIPQYNGYFAVVGFFPIEGKPYRGSGFHIGYKGLQKVYTNNQ